MRHSKLQPTEIEGKRYYTVSQFARLVGAWPSRISLLVNAENPAMKIPAIRIAERPFIHEDEVQRYIDARGVKNEDCDV